jgi:hypothetical protein
LLHETGYKEGKKKGCLKPDAKPLPPAGVIGLISERQQKIRSRQQEDIQQHVSWQWKISLAVHVEKLSLLSHICSCLLFSASSDQKSCGQTWQVHMSSVKQAIADSGMCEHSQ